MSHAALILSHSLSPRLQYVVDFLSQFYGLPFKIIYDEEKYIQSQDACKINYNYHRLSPGEIFIHSHVLLFESSIRQVKVECFEKDGYKAFFKAEGDHGFDLFAAIFFLLTRYEEYLPHKKDALGRYGHQNALAFKEGFLDQPLINIWLEDFRKLLMEKNDAFTQPASRYNFLPTYDIDMAWSFRNKGFKRNAGALLLLLMKVKFSKMVQRMRVLRGKKQDPYDSYDWMHALHHRYKLEPVFFFLVAKESGRRDKNISVENPEFRSLVQDMATRYKAGLHPSWASGDHPSLLTKEKGVLESLTGAPVTTSRQHFIRFELPSTYRRLLTLGITEDHSMGYGSINGFRASIATPYYWYDLKNEERTRLLIHPFCFMDANAYYEQKQSPDEALAEMLHYLSAVRNVNGTLITIWHNSFLGTDEAFEGWREVYERFVEEATA